MKISQLLENDSSRSNANMQSRNLRSTDPVEPKKKREVAAATDTPESVLANLRARVAAIKRFGDSGDFYAIHASELTGVDSGVALIVYKNKKKFPEKSFLRIKNNWIALETGKKITPAGIIAAGQKLGDDYGWAMGQIK